MKTTLEKLINKKDYSYINSEITDKNFPVPEKIQTEGWKIIRMNKSFSSKEALDKIKSEGCRPANVYELITWANEHKEAEMPLGKWSAVLAFGSECEDADGCHRVPDVYRDSGGDFEFDLGYFESDWYGDDCLLCFCDDSTQAISTSETKTSDPLMPAYRLATDKEIAEAQCAYEFSGISLDIAISVCKANGLKVVRTVTVTTEEIL